MLETRQASFTNETNPRQVAINFGSMFVLIGINFLGSFLLTPFLIGIFDVGLYSFIPLTQSLVDYSTIVTTSLSASINRFFTLNVANEDWKGANNTFTNAILGTSIVSAVIIGLAVVFSQYLPTFFDIPQGVETHVAVLFVSTAFAVVLVFMAVPFSASLYASNRLDLQNLVQILRVVIRISVIILLCLITIPRITYVGYGAIAGGVVLLGAAILLQHRMTPQVKLSPSGVDLDHLKAMSGMSGWTIVNQTGSLLFLNTDLLITNLLLGAAMGGVYGAIAQIPIYIRLIVSFINSTLSPVVMIMFAQGEFARIHRLSFLIVKFTGLGMAAVIGSIVGFGQSFLVLWLGEDFGTYAPLLSLAVFHYCVNQAVTPLFPVQIAYNKVRLPAVVTLVMGGANVLLALVLGNRYGLAGIIAAYGIVLTIKNSIFTPIYTARIQSLPWTYYYRALLPGVVGTVIVALCGWFLSDHVVIHHFLTWIAVVGAMITLYFSIVYLGVLKKEEKAMLRSWIHAAIPKL